MNNDGKKINTLITRHEIKNEDIGGDTTVRLRVWAGSDNQSNHQEELKKIKGVHHVIGGYRGLYYIDPDPRYDVEVVISKIYDYFENIKP
jgi:hypothetical protein